MNERRSTVAILATDEEIDRQQTEPQDPDKKLLEAAKNCDGFDALEELEYAIRHTREARFGKTEQYMTPLSRQFLTEIKRYFPADASVFAASDKLKIRIEDTVLLMRFLTVATFSVYAALSFAIVQMFFEQPQLLSFLPDMLTGPIAAIVKSGDLGRPIVSASVLLVALGIVAYALRHAIRSLSFLIIRVITTEFSHNLSSRYEEIHKRIVECFLAAGKRGPSWHLRSKLYTIVAIWSAKRSEYLDRYSTISAWKIRWFVTWAERLSTAVKVGAAIGVSLWAGYSAWLVQTQEAWIFAVIASVVVLTMAVYFFLFRGRLPNDEWTRVLTGDISKSEQKGTHYFFQIGELVENLARTVLEVQRTPPSASAGGTHRVPAAE